MTDTENSTIEKTLPSAWYLREDIHQLEREHIFFREWFCVGREEDISAPGDHVVLDVCGQSILVLRNLEGVARAFYNVCRHRGAQLCPHTDAQVSTEESVLKGGVVGKKKILCPYHAWTYDLDGQLLRTPHMDESMGFEYSETSLHKVGCEVWAGFIFVNLSPDEAPSFDQLIAASAQQFQRYPLPELRIGHRIAYDVDANWKVLCENYNECYHCGPVHPELCQIVPAFRTAGGAGLDWERGVPHREGAVTFTASGTTDRRMFPGLDEDEQQRHKGDLIYPNVFLSLASDHVVVFLLFPISAAKTRIDCLFLFEAYEMDKADFNPSDAVEFWDLVNRQDWSICARVQAGMNARVHEQGLFSPMEDWNLDIRRYVQEKIGPYITT